LPRRDGGGRRLDVGTSKGEIRDENEDGDGEQKSGGTVPEFDPTEVVGLADVVGKDAPSGRVTT
jgi:hypothetical protein